MFSQVSTVIVCVFFFFPLRDSAAAARDYYDRYRTAAAGVDAYGRPVAAAAAPVARADDRRSDYAYPTTAAYYTRPASSAPATSSYPR